MNKDDPFERFNEGNEFTSRTHVKAMDDEDRGEFNRKQMAKAIELLERWALEDEPPDFILVSLKPVENLAELDTDKGMRIENRGVICIRQTFVEAWLNALHRVIEEIIQGTPYERAMKEAVRITEILEKFIRARGN